MGYNQVIGHIDLKHILTAFCRDHLPSSIAKPISKYAEKVDSLLRFPGDLIMQFQRERELGIHRYSVAVHYGNTWLPVNYNAGTNGHHMEGPYNLVLYSDNKPLCSVAYGYKNKAIIIHQMQGVRGLGGNDNFDLAKFSWTHVLVRLIEEIGKIQGKSRVIIQSAHCNKWGSIRRNENGQGKKIYDDTANALGYIMSEDHIRWKYSADGVMKGYFYKDILSY